jgi:hypothetical protein
MDQVVLFGVGSDGTGAQFDGGQPPKGVMLRWLQVAGLGFPEHGYEVERAPIPDLASLDWGLHLDEIEGTTSYEFHGGAATLASDQPLTFPNINGFPHLAVAPGQTISVAFEGPAWWTVVRGRPTGGTLTVQGLAGGVVKVEEALQPGWPVEWRTRGMDEIRVIGDGLLELVQYQSLDAKRAWAHVAHVCLPVLDPRYPCAPAGGPTNEDIAKSRVPGGVDWAGRYAPDYHHLDDLLTALATKTPTPGGGLVTASPSSTRLPPQGRIDADGSLQIAMLDPHLARAVGMLYDDDTVAIDGAPWAYRVTGSWDGPSKRVTIDGLRAAGLTLTVDGRAAKPSERGAPVIVKATATLDATKAKPRFSSVDIEATPNGRAVLKWELTDIDGNQDSGSWRPRRDESTLRATASSGRAIATVTISSSAEFTIAGLTVPGRRVERSSILPFVLATGAPAPTGPSSLSVTIDTPGGGGTSPQAALRWDVNAGADPFTGGLVTYQAAAAQLSNDPDIATPTPPPFDDKMVLDQGALTLVPPATVAAGDPMALDRPLPEGWRAWWVRGVDLFGRVSAPAGPELRAVVDAARPPPPVILAAEYAQAGLDPQLAAMLGQSSAGAAWIGAQPAPGAQSAAIVTFGWTPELAAQCPDVDAFRIYARTPASDGTWTARPWGTPIALLGSFPTRFDGTVSSVDPALATVDITAIELLEDTQSRCTTDLAVEVSGGLIGTELVAGGTVYPVISHGEGPATVFIVSHMAGNAPPVGTAALRAAATGVRLLTTTITAPALSSNPHRRRVAGVLVASAERFVVLSEQAGSFLVSPIETTTGTTTGPVIHTAVMPAVGAAISWYPAYRVAVADNGFGPRPTQTTPNALAQLAVTAVRRSVTRPAESPPSLPATVHAVDVTPPGTPTIPVIPSGEKCAQLASAADWHGISRFTLTWNTAANVTGYHVHRAMDDAVRQADADAHGRGPGAQPHTFAASALPADPARAAAVLADLAAVDAALTGGDPDTIRAAYREMRADAWQLVAGQDAVASAFVLLNGVPFDASATSFEDRFDGFADSHWFYRVSARNIGGLTSGLSPSTPPICAPRTTPPRPPRALLALAGEGSVTLRFAPSPSANIARYRVYRTYDRALADDVRDMLDQAHLAPTATSTPAAGEVRPTADGAALRWVDTAATPGREWFYRIVAEDVWGNRSEPTGVLAQRSLHPLPAPPVWNPPSRGSATITLSWTHGQARMASRVERRRPGGMWREVTGGWLPRGQYQYDDDPPDVNDAWEYRLTVRDHADHLAAVTPVTTIAEVAP